MRRGDQVCVNRRKRRVPAGLLPSAPSSNRTSDFPGYGSPTIFPMCLSATKRIFMRTPKAKLSKHVVAESSTTSRKNIVLPLQKYPQSFSDKSVQFP